MAAQSGIIAQARYHRQEERPLDYQTADRTASGEFTEKKSRFIGSISPVRTEAEAVAFIQQVQKTHPQARHHVYAYILRDGNLSRYSDAGEPSGTGGQPALQVLVREGLTDVCVVVTRYFGGVLLGAGGLTRAYARGAKVAVDAAGVAVMRLCCVYTVRCSYALYQRLLSMLEQEACTVGESVFTDEVAFSLSMRAQDTTRILEKLSEASAGTASVTYQCEKYVKYKKQTA